MDKDQTTTTPPPSEEAQGTFQQVEKAPKIYSHNPRLIEVKPLPPDHRPTKVIHRTGCSHRPICPPNRHRHNFFANLQNRKDREKQQLLYEAKWMDTAIPYSSMKRLGWVKVAVRPVSKAKNLRKFLRVPNLSRLSEVLPPVNFPSYLGDEKGYYTSRIWLRKVQLDAREIKTKPIDIEGLKENLPKILSLARLNSKPSFKVLKDLLAEYGVALVLLEHLKNSRFEKVVFYDEDRIVIGIDTGGLLVKPSSKETLADVLSCLGRIVLGHLKENDRVEVNSTDEEADDWARKTMKTTYGLKIR